jgi:hypothetical protein
MLPHKQHVATGERCVKAPNNDASTFPQVKVSRIAASNARIRGSLRSATFFGSKASTSLRRRRNFFIPARIKSGVHAFSAGSSGPGFRAINSASNWVVAPMWPGAHHQVLSSNRSSNFGRAADAMSTPLHDRRPLPAWRHWCHTPEVNQSEGAGPPHQGAVSVSPEGRSSRSGLLLFHRAIRSLHAALFPGTKIPGYAHFTQSMWIIAATSSVSANGLQFCPVDSPANRAQSFCHRRNTGRSAMPAKPGRDRYLLLKRGPLSGDDAQLY